MTGPALGEILEQGLRVPAGTAAESKCLTVNTAGSRRPVLEMVAFFMPGFPVIVSTPIVHQSHRAKPTTS